MKRMILLQLGPALVMLLLFSLMSLFLEKADGTDFSVSRRESPVLSGEVKTYTSAIEHASDPITIPEAKPSQAGDLNDQADMERRMRLLGERFKPSAQSLCEEVAVGMQNYSKEVSVSNGAPFMERIADIQAVADFRRVFPFPIGTEKVVVLQCSATILYSIKVEARTDFYLMVDSDNNNRVRWVPDNTTAKKVA